MMRIVEVDIYADETPEERDAKVIAIWNELHPEDCVMRCKGGKLYREDEILPPGVERQQEFAT
mgnify:CR=1 FL=1